MERRVNSLKNHVEAEKQTEGPKGVGQTQLQATKTIRSLELKTALQNFRMIWTPLLEELREHKEEEEYEHDTFYTIENEMLSMIESNGFKSHFPLYLSIKEKFMDVTKRYEDFHDKLGIVVGNLVWQILGSNVPITPPHMKYLIETDAWEMSTQELKAAIPALEREIKKTEMMTAGLKDIEIEWDEIKKDLNEDLNDCIDRANALVEEMKLLFSFVLIIWISIFHYLII
ncbi:unnamed protein product [Orchesella dallaii]|uniref:Uncharacterized protein n=1 Tax=Orchesella dallaii TaxID=48710 RepID=A0ABP1QLH7_9HEXA